MIKSRFLQIEFRGPELVNIMSRNVRYTPTGSENRWNTWLINFGDV